LPPLTESEIVEAEGRLGFQVPPLLRELYQHVGNGRFGPGFGLLSLNDLGDGEPSVLGTYLGLRQHDPDDPSWEWPDRLLPICDWGCNIFSCLDCATPPNAVLTFERVSGEPMEVSFAPTRDSFEVWLRDWLAGAKVFEPVYEPAPERDYRGRNPATGDAMILKGRRPRRRSVRLATAKQARESLSHHGVVQPQPVSDWTGAFPLPAAIEQFYQEVGPVDVTIRSYGNPFFLPRLSGLWEFQAGYRWNGLSGEPIDDWNDDWLVVADEGGDPFIFQRSSGTVLHAYHGEGEWDAHEMFPDPNTMAACLGFLGTVVVSAGETFTDDDHCIRSEHCERAMEGLMELLGSESCAEMNLEELGWG
jgi:hypothetical protein